MKLLNFNPETGWAIYQKEDGKPDATHLVCKTKDAMMGNKEKTVVFPHPIRDENGEPTECGTCGEKVNDATRMMLRLAHSKL